MFRRVGTAGAAIDQIKIAGDAECRERRREEQPPRAEASDGLRTHCVEGVGDQRGRGDDRDQRVEKWCAVTDERPSMCAGIAGQREQLGPPFAQR